MIYIRFVKHSKWGLMLLSNVRTTSDKLDPTPKFLKKLTLNLDGYQAKGLTKGGAIY